MPCVVVGEIPSVSAVADDEELQEAQQCLAIPIAGVSLVINDLLHGPARADRQGLQLDLHHRYAVDEQHHVVAVMAVVSVHAQLVDDLKVVLAPVPDVHQGVVQRRTIVALEAVDVAQRLGGVVHIRRDHAVEQALEFAVGQANAVEGLELFAEVRLQRGTVADIGAIRVFEIFQCGNQISFDLVFCCRHEPAPFLRSAV